MFPAVYLHALYTVNKETANIETILSLCPSVASIADSRGQKPLFQALHCKRQWFSGVQLILTSDRAPLREQDPETRLYPFMLAASPADDRRATIVERPRKRQKLDSCNDSSAGQEDLPRIQLTTIYRLLAEDPSVLSAALSR